MKGPILTSSVFFFEDFLLYIRHLNNLLSKEGVIIEIRRQERAAGKIKHNYHKSI